MCISKLPFIHLFQTNKKKYAYDVNSNDIVELNEISFDYFKYILSGLSFEKTYDILKKVYNSADIDKVLNNINQIQATNRLFSNNKPKIISYSIYDQQIDYLLKNYTDQITLEVTQRCNQRCLYCTFSDMYPNSRLHSDEDMPWEIAQRALDYIIVHGGKEANPYLGRKYESKNISVGFYGGEPLLNFDLIIKCIHYVNNKLEPNRECRYSLTTNGTLLSKEIAKLVIDFNICIGISLDGPPEIHNRARLFRDGRETYDKVIEGIINIQEYASMIKRDTPIPFLINTVISGNVSFVDLWEYFTSLENILYSNHCTFQILPTFTTVPTLKRENALRCFKQRS